MSKDENSIKGFSGDTVALAFFIGALLGAGAALLLTPEPGMSMRSRLLRGAKAAQEEFTEVANETREALEVLGKDARQTLRRTASRLNTAIEATREAIKNRDEDQ